MDKNKEIESINRKYTELISKAWNDTEHISIDRFFDEVLPKLVKEKEQEILMLYAKNQG